MLRLDWKLNSVCSAGFVKDADVHNLSVEEMFPISSNFVPEEENLRLYDMSTYAVQLGIPLTKLPVAPS